MAEPAPPLARAADPIAVEPVACPDCGARDCEAIARGPDYDEHLCGEQEFSLVRCRRCSVYYLDPRPTQAMLPLIYSEDDYYAYRMAEQGDSFVLRARDWRNTRKLRDLLQAAGRPVAETRVLEIGPGDGALLRAAHRVGIPAQQIVGLDLAERAVEHVERLGFRGILGRVEDVQLEPGSFDLVMMIQAIEHVVDPRRVLQGVHRLLRPGGLFLVETPNMDCWDRRFFRRRTWGGYHFPRHFTLWGPQTLTRMLEETGFSVESLSTPAAAVTWAWSLRHVAEARGWGAACQRFFSERNPLALGFFWALDLLPSLLGRSANMRLTARALEPR